jgi:hypothetical protein
MTFQWFMILGYMICMVLGEGILLSDGRPFNRLEWKANHGVLGVWE